jgi:hypothetical protein
MKKSNWILLALAAIACAFLLYLWFYLGFNKIDNPLDLVLAVLWWAIIAAVGCVIAKAEKARQRQVRTVYVAGNKLYNSEAGEVEVEAETTTVSAIQQVLAGLSYGFDKNDLPGGTQVQYVVETDEFKDGDEPTWKGKVTKVVSDGENVETDFDGADALAAALA